MDVIHRCQIGDEGAFEALFHQYRNLVYRIAYLMLYDSQEAEDVLQEVFLRVHRSLPTFEPSKGAFTTWLYRIAVNHCLGRGRKRRPSFVGWEEKAFCDLERAFSFQDRLDDQQAIQQALSRLSGKLRATVILRYYLELSYADIPLGTVKSRLDLALKTLRKELGTTSYTFLKEVTK